MKREKKTKPALWTTAFPEQLRKTLDPKMELKLYRKESKTFILGLPANRTTCPVAFKIFGKEILVHQVHHIRGRGRGGRSPLLRDQRFWLAVCQEGHNWIHANPEAARQRGWYAAKGDWNRHD